MTQEDWTEYDHAAESRNKRRYQELGSWNDFMVTDPSSSVFYKPNLDSCDIVSRQSEAMYFYNSLKGSLPFLIHVCESMGLPLIDNNDINVLKIRILFHLTSSDDKSRYIDKFIQLAKKWDKIRCQDNEEFINGVCQKNDIETNKLNDEVQKNISYGMLPRIRWAHMIAGDKININYMFETEIGKDWPQKMYGHLKSNKIFRFRNYAAELFDEDTILIYDRKYKPEHKPLWREEDLVKSQSVWHEKKTILRTIGNFLYNLLRPGMDIGAGLAGHNH